MIPRSAVAEDQHTRSTSLAIMIVISTSAAAAYALNGAVDWPIAATPKARHSPAPLSGRGLRLGSPGSLLSLSVFVLITGATMVHEDRGAGAPHADRLGLVGLGGCPAGCSLGRHYHTCSGAWPQPAQCGLPGRRLSQSSPPLFPGRSRTTPVRYGRAAIAAWGGLPGRSAGALWEWHARAPDRHIRVFLIVMSALIAPTLGANEDGPPAPCA